MAFFGCLYRSHTDLVSSINIKSLLVHLWLYGLYVALHSFPQIEWVLLTTFKSFVILVAAAAAPCTRKIRRKKTYFGLILTWCQISSLSTNKCKIRKQLGLFMLKLCLTLLI